MKKILFFVPGKDEVYNLLVSGPLSQYSSECAPIRDIEMLKEYLLHDLPQLVFVGTQSRTGIEPAMHARLIKTLNRKAIVVLVSSTEQAWTPPLDGFVILQGAYYREFEGLAHVVMSRA